MADLLDHSKSLLLADEDKDREAELNFHQLLGRYGDNKPIIEENVTHEDKIIDQKPLAYRYGSISEMFIWIWSVLLCTPDSAIRDRGFLQKWLTTCNGS